LIFHTDLETSEWIERAGEISFSAQVFLPQNALPCGTTSSKIAH